MKTYIILLITLLITLNTQAQIQDVTVRSLDTRTAAYDSQNETTLEKNKYYKDLNNRLGYYIGEWEGSYADKALKIENVQYKDMIANNHVDVIITKYKVTTNAGEELYNSLMYGPMFSFHIRGSHFVDYEYTIYKSWYEGDQADCNQTGWMMMKKINENSFKLWVEPSVEILPYGCPEGDLHILPTSEEEAVVMTKQN
ncbi:hypothetical protein [Psychroflexus montanilacus]|uniref:hypothetical protein n=1 Tax=Psychroflexus montanilacus TaxID=2873598 RepID=UPI001CCA692D|nr:hypothetical protein [Psychroflexus montanilacus]MBZ9652207.1 hypothetical protein [Psychroflexus montanilacus]